ncbi:NnrS family protein [Novosphingobium sp.]|uniref:NnrS family protein n=2 Tax=unclassified Novosphingobium TaxID=2644732 RepID=UPI0025D34C36|nr:MULTISPECIES: NnrS family protein [unclassified Novosphingobium]HQV03940.1 NnrS family protein [Novosphingobium sp.]
MPRPSILFAAPHRLAFLTGSLGLLSVAAWWLVSLMGMQSGLIALGPGSLPAALMHGPAMIFLSYSPFIFGFLLTVFPRWMGLSDLTLRQFGPIAALLAAGSGVAQVGLWTSAVWAVQAGFALFSIGWTVGLVVLAMALWSARRAGKPPCWHAASAIAALLSGLLALLLVQQFVYSDDPRLLRAANQLAMNACLLPIFLTVAHRMVPFFAASAVTGYHPWRPNWLLPALWVLLLARLLGGLVLLDDLIALGSFGLAVLGTLMLWRWWPRAAAPGLLKVLIWGFAWAPVGFGLSGLASIGLPFGLAPTHALMIGFSGSLLVAMVTRVTQGHSGRPLEMFALGWLAFVAVQVAAVLRVWAALRFEHPALLSVAALVFLIGLMPWLLRNAAIYVRPRIDGRNG